MSHVTAGTRPVETMRPLDPPAEALVGTELGSYRLLSLIGQGGMGRVYRAEHRALGRQVAIKLLRPSLASRRRAVARFFQEARVVNRIRHHNIVDITDFVELPDGPAFIVMELLEGCSLRELLTGALPLALALDIVDQVCAALEATHRIGVVHRDLKPGNIFVCADRSAGDWVKLLDFGVAKLADLAIDDDHAPDTAEGAVIGTPAYMSPEQATGEAVDARSDIYALGTILYELVCGAPPFRARRFVDYVQQHTAMPPRPPSESGTGQALPAALEALILRCLAKRPEDRYQDVAALRADLAATRAALAPAPTRRWRAGLVAGALLLIACAVLLVARASTGAAGSAPTPPRTAPASESAATPSPAAPPAPSKHPEAAQPAPPEPMPVTARGDERDEPAVLDRRTPSRASSKQDARGKVRRHRDRASRPVPAVAREAGSATTAPAVTPAAPAATAHESLTNTRSDDGEVHPAATINPF